MYDTMGINATFGKEPNYILHVSKPLLWIINVPILLLQVVTTNITCMNKMPQSVQFSTNPTLCASVNM